MTVGLFNFGGNPMKFLRLPDLLSRLGVSRSWVYDQIRNGNFPKPLQIGPRSVAWLESDIEDWAFRLKGTPK